MQKPIQALETPLYVTKPYLPPLEDYVEGLRSIWDAAWLTNGGSMLGKFHAKLQEHLDHRNLCLFVNGTLALQIALEGLRLEGEVITTPFTFVATSHAAVRAGLKPVFADIEPDHYTLDPAAVEAAITPRTSAILAVHVFGHPCRLDALADVARRHHLALVYDAAHAFGLTVHGRSIAHWGDVSMFSFHATKPFHSIEGGLLAFADPKLGDTFNRLKNFGIVSEDEIAELGTNAKMNEFQALMGLAVLPHLRSIAAARAAVARVYRERLAEVEGLRLPPPLPEGCEGTHAYQPVEVLADQAALPRDRLHARLRDLNIMTRRYFHPLLADCAPYQTDGHVVGALPVARRVARQILTLPIHHDLSAETAHRVCDILQHLV